MEITSRGDPAEVEANPGAGRLLPGAAAELVGPVGEALVGKALLSKALLSEAPAGPAGRD
ncbi:MAG: hypothetical protein JO144_08935 [Actinobacteria bacterium]|nr:hypothetical protein [Actinomycetota bacterium]